MDSKSSPKEKEIVQNKTNDDRENRPEVTKSHRRTRRLRKACPSTTILDITLPIPLASQTVLRIAAQAVYRYVLCSHGFSPLPIEQVLSLSMIQNNQRQRMQQKIHRLRQQVMQFEKTFEKVLKSNSDSLIQCIMLSCGTSFARPRNLYLIDASCLANDSTQVLQDETPLARKVIRHVLQHDDTTSSSSPRQQLFLSIGIHSATAVSLEHPANWIHRREWNLKQFLQTTSSRPPKVYHIRLFHRLIEKNSDPFERLTWFSLKSTIKPVRER